MASSRIKLSSVGNLHPDHQKVFENIMHRYDEVLESFKLLKKDYSGVKNNVKRIEKKLLTLIPQLPQGDFLIWWIESEVSKIENKYPAIERSIRLYEQEMSIFHSMFKTVYGNPSSVKEKHMTDQLSHFLSSADSRISAAENDIRIAKKYFKNVRSPFKSAAERLARR